jgi:hypothetical protein
MGAIHGTNKGEVQAAKSIGRMQFLKTRLRDITDERTIETLSRMNCNMYRSERQDKLMIDTSTNTYAFGFAGTVATKSYYKAVHHKGQLFEAIALVRQRTYDNSIAQLIYGRFVQIQKFYTNEDGHWKMIVVLIEDNELTEMIALPIDRLDKLCVAIITDGKIYPKPVLPSFALLLR